VLLAMLADTQHGNRNRLAQFLPRIPTLPGTYV
jgi:hypothetical protein